MPVHMDHKEIRTLKLLEAVESNGKTSQRALAQHLNISLGLVNSCFRKLMSSGFFSIKTGEYGDIRYQLTRKGLREKARLTHDYILLSYSLFRDARGKLTGFFAGLEAQHIRRLVYCGVNDFAEMAYLSMRDTSLEMVAVVDDEKTGQWFFGKKVGTMSILDNISFDRLLFTDPEIQKVSFSNETFINNWGSRVIDAPFGSL